MNSFSQNTVTYRSTEVADENCVPSQTVANQINTDGGAKISGNVDVGGDLIGRDNTTIVNNGILIIHHTSEKLLRVGSEINELGSSSGIRVQLLQHGQYLTTYSLNREEEPKPINETKIGAKQRHVAVLVDITRPIIHDVATYLDDCGITADIVIVTNDPELSGKTRFVDISNPLEWTGIIREFRSAVMSIQRSVPRAQLHFFLSIPVTLAFGLGAVWGIARNAIVYHFDGTTYLPLVPLDRSLLSEQVA